jgi:hypothetical protein
MKPTEFALLPVALALAASAAAARPAAAQRLIDWPIRTSADADAIAAGAVAAFWNPAATARLPGRAQGFLMDMEGFRDSGLGGLAAAGAIALKRGITIGAGFSHLAVGPINLTSTSPTDSLGQVDVAEDLLAVAAAQRLGTSIFVGVDAQYSWANAIADRRSELGVGTGILWSVTSGLEPALGASVMARGSTAEWLLGGQIARLLEPVQGLRFGVSAGLSGTGRSEGVSERAALSIGWRDILGASVGAAGEAQSGGTAWDPLLGADLHLDRYTLAVLREGIANGFGAAYYYQLRVRF